MRFAIALAFSHAGDGAPLCTVRVVVDIGDFDNSITPLKMHSTLLPIAASYLTMPDQHAICTIR